MFAQKAKQADLASVSSAASSLRSKDKIAALADASPSAQQQASLQRSANNRPNQTGLPDQLKSGLEHLSGLDLSNLRVHENSDQPAQLSAHAFARGTEIHLAPGHRDKMAHESWHVVQQLQQRVPVTRTLGSTSINDSAALEREADVMGATALRTASPAIFPDPAPVVPSGGPVQRVLDDKLKKNIAKDKTFTKAAKKPHGKASASTGTPHLETAIQAAKRVLSTHKQPVTAENVVEALDAAKSGYNADEITAAFTAREAGDVETIANAMNTGPSNLQQQVINDLDRLRNFKPANERLTKYIGKLPISLTHKIPSADYQPLADALSRLAQLARGGATAAEILMPGADLGDTPAAAIVVDTLQRTHQAVATLLALLDRQDNELLMGLLGSGLVDILLGRNVEGGKWCITSAASEVCEKILGKRLKPGED